MATTAERPRVAVARTVRKVQAPPAAISTQEMAAEGLTLHGVSWKTYELLLADHNDQRTPRFTYDRGELEIASPSFEHERVNLALALLVKVVAEVLEIDAVAAGTMPAKRANVRRGFQPDSSFYIAHAAQVREKSQIDLERDPPPDLVIEVDITQSTFDKLPIFLAFGIPEVWRFSGGRVSISILDGAAYREVTRSIALPIVTADALTRFVKDDATQAGFVWLRSLRRWARQQAKKGTVDS